MKQRPHEKLIVWQESYQLTLWVYELTKTFPIEEVYSLTKQMRRSSYSVPTNIAEGNTKRSKKDRCRYLEIAEASLEELHCQFRLAHDLGYTTDKIWVDANEWIRRIGYLLHKLQSSLKGRT